MTEISSKENSTILRSEPVKNFMRKVEWTDMEETVMFLTLQQKKCVGGLGTDRYAREPGEATGHRLTTSRLARRALVSPFTRKYPATASPVKIIPLGRVYFGAESRSSAAGLGEQFSFPSGNSITGTEGTQVYKRTVRSDVRTFTPH